MIRTVANINEFAKRKVKENMAMFLTKAKRDNTTTKATP
jgi:hypothetical protein